MTTLNKILIAITVLTIIGALGFVAYKTNELGKQQAMLQEQVVAQKQLADGIVRSSSSYATKEDIEHFITSNNGNLQVIQDDLKGLRADLTAANVLTVNSSPQVSNHIASSHIGPANPTPTANPIDTYGYLAKAQLLDINETFGTTIVPFGQVGFSAWQQAPWNINIKPREYKVTNVIGTDENQRTYVYNTFSVKVDNKDYDVKITSSETKQELPEAKWCFWCPQLFLSASGGVSIQTTPPLPGSGSIVSGQFIPSVNFGFINRGMYKTQPEWSFAQIGLGVGVVDRRPELVVVPAAWNIGQKVPFIKNTYLAPSLAVGTSGSIAIMAGFVIGL